MRGRRTGCPNAVTLTYPRTCETCGGVFKRQQAYSRHKVNQRCHPNNQILNATNAQINNTNIGVQNNVTNNNINLYVTIQQDFAELLKAPFHSCTAKERKQIIDVLCLLRDKGYKTATDIQNFIMDEYVTLQEMEQIIRKYDLDCLRVIVKEYRHEDKEEHVTRCVVALFNRLVCKDEPFITPDTLKCNPLHKAANGQLSAWSEDSVYSYGSSEFGVPLNSEGQNGEKKKQWTPMQEEATWKTLIEVISLRFIEALQMQRHYDSWQRDSDDSLNLELADYWEKCLDDKSPKNGPSNAISRLCTELASICRQDYTAGWHNLTKLASHLACGKNAPDRTIGSGCSIEQLTMGS